jgi:peptidoglycan/LPS O-acetylase OafA/YrhL
MTSRTWFRADIQALRALAVLLVVAYHAGIPGVRGGFFGVDVFFVISGFVITQVLLRERESTHGTSLFNFYARRIRRIVPLAAVVVVATVFATYHYLAYVTGAVNAHDALWVLLFSGNVHFAALRTNYFTQQLPPSTLQQYWSLAVEEQFYFMWPVVFLLATRWRTRLRTDRVLTIILAAIIIASFVWCVHETSSAPTWAFFSPLSRAWELGCGALLAVLESAIVGRAPRIGRALGVIGISTLVIFAWAFTGATQWPGSAAALPVLATVALIGGGTLVGPGGFAGFITWRPLQWLGNVSYSWYLVHWPIFALATQYSFSALPLHSRLELFGLSLLLAAVAYYTIDRPIRRSRWLAQHRVATYVMGGLCIGLAYGAVLWHLSHY